MTTLTQSTSPLRGLDDADFAALVDRAVRGDLDEATAESLKDPQTLDRSYLALVTMKKSVEGQLAAKKADYVRNVAKTRQEARLRQIEEQYRQWRGGALRFKSGVETWLMILRQARQQTMPDLSHSLIRELDKQERNKFMTAYDQLRSAVAEHRDHICDSSCDAECVADVKLWQAIQS